MNLLNKKNQHYDVLGRFRVNTDRGEVEFCRVKFMATKHEDVIPATKVESGDFEDTSIVVRTTPVKPILVAKTTEEDKAKIIEAFEKTKEQPVTIIEPNSKIVSLKTGDVLTEQGLTVPIIPKGIKIIATNPKGKEFVVDSFLELNEFCSKNNLDVEGVQAVIDGAQKTHKKWRFAKA
ncbi:hypothetical protein [Bacillus paranthracis]|uniref:hypothetical protein n=1 Tax=Bacillus paranthracis TaxID=2026186 RepID=UPI00202D0855|nr:hypothetical protein [Bacillus paranthracis]MCM0006137.1 hypothetical protein [Bacillus paranthracis]MDX6046751.1 hypothetical protein [Bacillus paranthracis]